MEKLKKFELLQQHYEIPALTNTQQTGQPPRKEKHYIYVWISAIISVLSCVLMFLGADLFVEYLLTPEFHNAAVVIRIFSISPFFLFLMNTYGTNYLVIVGKENILRNIIVGCSALGFVLTCFFTIQFSSSRGYVLLFCLRGSVELRLRSFSYRLTPRCVAAVDCSRLAECRCGADAELLEYRPRMGSFASRGSCDELPAFTVLPSRDASAGGY